MYGVSVSRSFLIATTATAESRPPRSARRSLTLKESAAPAPVGRMTSQMPKNATSAETSTSQVSFSFNMRGARSAANTG